MRYWLSLAVLIIAVACFCTLSFGFTIAIDFEENPAPDLSEVINVYHGDARFIYAFLVIVGPATEGPEAHIAAYDVGYRLISSGNSVTNYGFFPVREWQYLDPSDKEPPANLNLPGANLPVAVGYWKLELRNGRGSHAEFQIVPNPANGSRAVSVIDGSGQTIAIPHEELSQSTTCHGLINKTFYSARTVDVSAIDNAIPGEVVVRFMPGVIEMDDPTGGIEDINDPGLGEVASKHRLVRIRRLFSRAIRNPEPKLSRTGKFVTPLDSWDLYVLEFPPHADMNEVINDVLGLPRTVYAGPSAEVGDDAFLATHTPNDSLASPGSGWHLYRVGMPEAWDYSVGDSATHIGIADAGLDYYLYDFGGGIGSGHKIAGGYDYTNGSAYPDRVWGDDAGLAEHGNWTTSVLGAIANNDTGVAGVAGGWGGYAGEIGPSIFHFKVRRDSGGVTMATVAQAMKYAYPYYQCGVVSVSMGFARIRSAERNALKEAVRDCFKFDTVVVSGFHNYDTPGTWYPGCFRNDWILCLQGSSRHRSLQRTVYRRDGLARKTRFTLPRISPGAPVTRLTTGRFL